MTSLPMWALPGVALISGYILGSIPYGVILTRLFGAGDLRAIGSGNIGATNVLRTGRKGLAAATLILDALKGTAAVLLGEWLGGGLGIIAGVAAFVGHLYPIWLRFRGGKGVATMLGIAVAFDWRIGLAYALVWLVGMAISRISSVGGMSAAVAAPVAAYILGAMYVAPSLAGLAILVLWKHQENIRRLVAGTEPRIGQKSA